MGEAFGHFQARLGQGAFEVPLEFQKDEIVLLALDRHDIIDVPDAGLDVAVGDGVDFYGVLVGDAAGEQKARRKQGVQAGPWKRHGYGEPWQPPEFRLGRGFVPGGMGVRCGDALASPAAGRGAQGSAFAKGFRSLRSAPSIILSCL